MTRDIAIAHWAETCNGGGERVAWALARAFDAPLFVGRARRAARKADLSAVWAGVVVVTRLPLHLGGAQP